ncbi:hypothetical protein RJT34_18892 [Clitoria ternatea]|uniref:Gnk2-homologous domain-containing protein n=1 Tax=Clitoria ternatea TaxID=43366 RepID=A0AAN9P3K5_CLITE
MGILRRKHFTLLFLFTLFTPPLRPATLASAAETTTLVYKGCSEQKLQDPYSQSLKPLLSSLVAESAQKGFAATTQSSITAVYQCRGDLTNSDCYNCVSKIPSMLDKLCGDVAAARVQLSGCYLRYEVVGFRQVPQTQLLYKVCGSRKVSDGGGGGFEARRDSAFQMVENGVQSGGGLFYTGSYQSLYVLGQCEGDLGNADCVACVKSAEEQAKGQCGDSISAQVYLQNCYISYSFYPNGVPNPTMSSSSGSGEHHQHTEKTVALVVGGLAALGFFIVCLLFLKSVLMKKRGKRSDIQRDSKGILVISESDLWYENGENCLLV